MLAVSKQSKLEKKERKSNPKLNPQREPHGKSFALRKSCKSSTFSDLPIPTTDVTMSAKTSPLDAKREEFRKYLEKEGILENLTKALVSTQHFPAKITQSQL